MNVRTYVRTSVRPFMYANVTSTRNHITGSSLELTTLQHTSLTDWTSMLWSIDTCQNKVSADQYHVTISRAGVGPYRGQLFFFFFKLTADQGLVVDWIAGSRKVRHTHTPERGLIFRALSCGSTRLQSHATSTKALDSRCFSCSGTVWKIYFSCIFRWFQSRFNII